jgi:hypothetical protein
LERAVKATELLSNVTSKIGVCEQADGTQWRGNSTGGFETAFDGTSRASKTGAVKRFYGRSQR